MWAGGGGPSRRLGLGRVGGYRRQRKDATDACLDAQAQARWTVEVEVDTVFLGSAAGTGGVDSWGNEDGGGRRGTKEGDEGGGGGKLEERDGSQEDRRRAPVQHFWVRIKGAGWAFVGEGMCLSVRLSLLAGCWLSAFGS